MRTVVAALSLLSAPLFAQPAERPANAGPPHILRVTGMGEVKVEPDRAQLALAVETSAPTAEDAARENALRVNRVIEALERAGLKRGDIETGRYALFPVHPQPPEQGTGGAGPAEFRALNRVQVTVDDLSRVGKTIDVAVAAGANRVEQLQFTVRDPQQAQQDALREAVRRARSQAQVVAGTLGVELGPVLEASTTLGGPPRPIPFRMEAQAAPQTPIRPAEQTVTASVSLAYDIKGPAATR